MPLLEIIAAPCTAPETLATAVGFGRRQGKTVIRVQDSVGFYVNRILAPYLNEAGYLLGEGVSIDAIDRALVEFGSPEGSFALLYEVGIDVGSKVGPILPEAFWRADETRRHHRPSAGPAGTDARARRVFTAIRG